MIRPVKQTLKVAELLILKKLQLKLEVFFEKKTSIWVDRFTLLKILKFSIILSNKFFFHNFLNSFSQTDLVYKLFSSVFKSIAC